jgi:hypothetical protein
MRKSIYRGSSIVSSTVPGGVYRAKINGVEYDNEKNRISITFTTTKNGHITRSFEALTKTNSKLREFVQGLIAPLPLPEVINQEELRGKLLEVVGNEYLIAYTMLPGSQRLGALSAVPFQKRAA